MRIRILLTFIWLACFNHLLQAQDGKSFDKLDQKYLNWHNLDPEIDNIQGVSVERAYKELLGNMTSKRNVVVAVIDGGVDVEHEDLQGKIWVNKGEVAGNGIDDDNNGYVDDIYGWNFLGNSNGDNVVCENFEQVRIIRKFDPVYKDVRSVDEIPADNRKEYDIYLQCKKQYEEDLRYGQEEKEYIEKFEKRLRTLEKLIRTYLGKEEYSKNDLEKIDTKDKNVLNAKNYLLSLYERGSVWDYINGIKDENEKYFDKYINLEYDARTIIADDIDDINDKYYGNGNVKCTNSNHGTFVSGIIAANRKNGIGINGIAANVEIMALRVVPDGDERDKDVALSIRYAVDNGANIINMSFGKMYSLQKGMVDDAIKYAEANNVLLVNAAGNESANNDVVKSFPMSNMEDGTKAKNFISVGATSMKLGKNFCGSFTNYGKESVDLFAPGVDIFSTAPENLYDVANGTSFSCPVVSGVAALVWSYYPELTALELKEIILNSSVKNQSKKVYCPDGSKKRKKMTDLSITGGVVNVYEALKMAGEYKKN